MDYVLKIKRMLLICMCVILQMSVYGCNNSKNKESEPAIIYDSNFADIDNVIYRQENLTPSFSKLIYGFKYSNMPKSKINISLELFKEGKLVKSINKDNNIDENIKEGHFGLVFARPLLIDNKKMIQWVIEHNNNMTFLSYEDFSFKTNVYSIDVDKEIYPKKDVSYSLITYYADPNNNNIPNTLPAKGSKELENFYTKNYNYVFFLKFRFS